MERLVKIGSLTPGGGLRLEWTYGFRIEVSAGSDEVLIRANKAGLTSLAQHLLTLAEDDVASGAHVHLDAGRELEDASRDLVLERTD
jgi:hypothetical protein